MTKRRGIGVGVKDHVWGCMGGEKWPECGRGGAQNHALGVAGQRAKGAKTGCVDVGVSDPA